MKEPAAIRWRVEPFEIPGIHERHYRGIFGDFGELIAQRLAELEGREDRSSAIKAEFCRFLQREVDREAYARIQQTYLRPLTRGPRRFPQRLKFLDPIYWFEGKLNAALRMGLDRMPPLEILDLGTGCGHLPTIARFFGHQVLGTDIELKPAVPEQGRHLYDALCEVFGVTKVADRIVPFQAVTDFGRRFDLVTGFLVAFNVFDDQSPWSVDAWQFFFDSLQRRVLKEDGRVYFQLTDGKLTDEVWHFLSTRAVWAQDSSKALYIEDVDPCTR